MPRADALTTYRRKRDFKKTPEPSGKPARSSPAKLRFVVQKHHASRLHYDFRLEAGGVLASWAVPKGPTMVAGERRLAMHVEDHPVDYLDFEGIIPEGQYGAGEVIVWDRGTYAVQDGGDPAREIEQGEIKFVLHGKKLRGGFTLVKMKPREGESGDPWLLVKERDGEALPKWDVDDHPESVKSGKTIEELASDPKAKQWQSSRLKRASHASAAQLRARVKRDPLPKLKSLMLATLIDEPFDDPKWLFEIKWDGYRALCTIDEKGDFSLLSRNGENLLLKFPEMSGLRDAFKSTPIMVDGEIVSLDREGRSDFQRLQEYHKKGGRLTYVAFDVIYADGRDQRKTPLEERKELLSRLIADDELVLYSKHVIGKGIQLYEQARERRLEGIIGKLRDSTYQERRPRDWVKIKAQQEQEFVVGGWTEPRGSRKGFGSLLLGAYEGKNLRYVGHVGTGFSVKLISEIMRKLRDLERDTSPFVNKVVANTKPHWVRPQLVAEVRFSEWTRDCYLRQPAFLGLRTDKDAKDVKLELPEHLAES
jgi:bifunctional non-homologous end joining protein LigD